MIWGVQGIGSRPAWFDTVGEGRQGQRSELGADHSALWTMIMISGGETEVQSGKRKAPLPQRWVKSERERG